MNFEKLFKKKVTTLFAFAFSWQPKSQEGIGQCYAWRFCDLFLICPRITAQYSVPLSWTDWHAVIVVASKGHSGWQTFLKRWSHSSAHSHVSSRILYQLRLCSRSGFPHLIVYFHEKASIFHTMKLMPNWDCVFYLKQSQEPRGKQMSFLRRPNDFTKFIACMYLRFFTQTLLFLNWVPVNWIISGFVCFLVSVHGRMMVGTVNFSCAENAGNPSIEVTTLEVRL